MQEFTLYGFDRSPKFTYFTNTIAMTGKENAHTIWKAIQIVLVGVFADHIYTW